VAEFQIADPVVALQGSGTADAPYLAFYLNAAGRQNITVEFDVRDIDGSTDNTNQQVAVQYRTSETGAWVNVPGGYIADASTGPSLATLVTHMAVTLPADANNATTLQVRVMTTNAAGNDEWVGIDNIHITSNTAPVADQPGAFSVSDATVVEGNAGTTPITFTVSRGSDSNVAASVHYTVTLPGGASGASASDFVAPVLSGDLAFAANEFTKTVTLQVAGDIVNEADETFTVTLSAPTGGAGIADGSGLGTILNDDAAPAPGTPFINEIHYDNTGNDAGEAIEIAGPAGTSLAGWSLVLYNGNGGAAYATVALGGVITNQDDGYGTVSVPTPGIQNGAPDGVALVDAQGHVVQFLSYEGVMVATSGPANGMTSTDIGVAEEPVPAAGFSLQLQGSGANYADFTWKAVPAADSFGHVNSGQDFIGANATGLIRVADTSVVEGDDNSHQLIFTVTRAGGLSGSGTVDYTLDVGSGAQDAASLNDIAPGTPLSGTLSFAPGESSKQVVITIAGDTVGEANERIGITLSHPTGQVAIQQGQAIGTIVNDDPIALAIYQIQGEGHRSAYVGQTVITNGIVTAVDTNGFYLQDAQGDGNARTSDAVFVFTGTAPAVSVGDALSVVGKVNEFLPSADAANLTVTEIDDATFTLVSSGNPLPAALVIGAGGLLPPSEVIDDDHLTSYDPAHDGIDFYESIEGMRVTVQTPLVVGTTNGFGETWVVASGGVGATGVSARGGITLSDGDLNPERIQLQSDSGLFAGYTPSHTEGDRLGDVTGIVSYSHGSYEVLVTGPVAVTDDVTLQPEVTGLDGDRNHLSVATYNLENIDPTDPQAKFDILAGNIVYNLSAPDILAVQEIQDADGPGGGTNLSGTVTAQKL
ncbi:MAG: hypothetical protein JO176_03415, partial [Acidimicrobiia bacterium]|nr:hypothetical protein [Acidimicrobiia bacterium]